MCQTEMLTNMTVTFKVVFFKNTMQYLLTLTEHQGTVIYTHSNGKVADTVHLKVLSDFQVFHLSLIPVPTA